MGVGATVAGAADGAASLAGAGAEVMPGAALDVMFCATGGGGAGASAGAGRGGARRAAGCAGGCGAGWTLGAGGGAGTGAGAGAETAISSINTGGTAMAVSGLSSP
jgi:hypothetical protein